ncbi:MAG: hypothetical protein ACLUDU_11055 [Butyricimonas faecihominis]
MATISLSGVLLCTPEFDLARSLRKQFSRYLGRESRLKPWKICSKEDDARKELYWYDLGNVFWWKITKRDDDANPIDSVSHLRLRLLL